MLSVLKNGHFKIAMIIAPILAVLAYLGVDKHLSEQPQPAKQGEAYPLAAQSNCRYESGICTLQNNDVKLNLKVSRLADERIGVVLESGLSLEGALITITDKQDRASPKVMRRNSDKYLSWYAELTGRQTDDTVIRLVVSVLGARYFAEVPARFIDYRTPYSRDNFSRTTSQHY